MIRKKTPYRIENWVCNVSSLVSFLDTFFSKNWMGAIQVPFYSRNWPTNFISIESYAQVLYSIEIIPRRIMCVCLFLHIYVCVRMIVYNSMLGYIEIYWAHNNMQNMTTTGEIKNIIQSPQRNNYCRWPVQNLGLKGVRCWLSPTMPGNSIMDPWPIARYAFKWSKFHPIPMNTGKSIDPKSPN